jgi:hypothetical protein
MARSVEADIDQWHTGTITSFKFLIQLKFFSRRTFADPSIYPVFPRPGVSHWTDMSTPSLDGTCIGGAGRCEKLTSRGSVSAARMMLFCGSVPIGMGGLRESEGTEAAN